MRYQEGRKDFLQVKRRFINWLIPGVGIVAMLCAALLPVVGQAPAEGDAKVAKGGKGGKGGGKGKAQKKGDPVTRLPDGHVDFGGPGVWGVPYITDMTPYIKDPAEGGGAPFTAKGKAEWDYNRKTQSATDPEGYCLPPGVPRMMYTPYPMEMLQLPNRVVFIYEGGAHVWRSIPIGTKEGLKHPADPNPTYLGDSYGWWDGDSLMIDVVGFNDRTWLDFFGHEHGEKLHVLEKYTRLDSLTLEYTATIEDPEYYTRPWTVTTTATYRPTDTLLEYICQENQKDTPHLEKILELEKQGKLPK